MPSKREPTSRRTTDGTARTGSDGAPPRPRPFSTDLLNLYLADHLAGATGGSQRIARMAEDFADSPVSSQLSVLATEIRAEREFLRRVIHDLGLEQKLYRQVIAWAGERLGRLKGNGRIVRRSPLTMLLETELMRSSVHGKLGLWQTLMTHAEDLHLDPKIFASLVKDTKRQLSTLDEIHAYARRHAFEEERLTQASRAGRSAAHAAS